MTSISSITADKLQHSNHDCKYDMETDVSSDSSDRVQSKDIGNIVADDHTSFTKQKQIVIKRQGEVFPSLIENPDSMTIPSTLHRNSCTNSEKLLNTGDNGTFMRVCPYSGVMPTLSLHANGYVPVEIENECKSTMKSVGVVVGGYQPSYSHEGFWERYFVLWDFKSSHISNPTLLERSEILLMGDEFEKQVLSTKLKRLVTMIAYELQRMDQGDRTEVNAKRCYDSDDEEVPFDVVPPDTLFPETRTKHLSSKDSPKTRRVPTKFYPQHHNEERSDECLTHSLEFESSCELVGILLGRSKVFVRRETYDKLEFLRSEKIYTAACYIQTFMRSNSRNGKYEAVYVARSLRKEQAARKIQSRIRIKSATKRMQFSRSLVDSASVKIQMAWKMYQVEKQRKLRSVIKIQSIWRGICARNLKVVLMNEKRLFLCTEIVNQDSNNERVIDPLDLKMGQRQQELAIVFNNDLIRLPGVLKVVETQQTSLVSTTSTANSILVVENATLLSELYREIEEQNWGVVDIILDKYPDLIRAPDIKTGELVLHKLARHKDVWPELLKMTAVRFPAALLHKDNMGALPIHHASAFDNINELEIIFDAYNEGVHMIDKMGRLPIHVAAMYDAADAVRFLLSKSTDLAEMAIYRPGPNNGGGLPLHVACAHNASSDVITALVAANAPSIKKTDENGDLPLHLLLRCGEVADPSVVQALITCFPGALSRTDSSGNLPLAIAIKCQCSHTVVHTILTHNPEAARIMTGDHQTPLVLALINHADDRSILALIRHAPEMARAVDLRSGLMPIQFATEYEHSHLIVKVLLQSDLPIDITSKVRAKLVPHHFSWNHLVANTDDLYHSVASEILQTCTQPQVLALAHTEGPDGRSALTAATVICKYEMRVMLRLFSTLEVMTERPAYTNVQNDTQIFYALRYDPPERQPGIKEAVSYSVLHERSSKMRNGREDTPDDYLEDFDDNSHVSVASRNSLRSTLTSRSQQNIESKLRHIRDEKGVHVIVKLTSKADIVERELNVRKNFQLSRHYVPAILSVHHTVQHAAYYEAMAESGFCVTMECADATAENEMNLMISADRAAVAKSLKRIGISLLHMHEHGLVHGDFGSHNVGRFGSRWKLLSVSGSIPIGELTNPNRGLYHPPEAIQIEQKQRSQVRGKKQQHGTASSIAIQAHVTYDIWAFGVFLYEVIAGIPLDVYACRGKTPMLQSELYRLGTWDEYCVQRHLAAIDSDDIALELLRSLLHQDPKIRPNSMRTVLEHRFFTGVTQARRCETVVPAVASPVSVICTPSQSRTNATLKNPKATPKSSKPYRRNLTAREERTNDSDNSSEDESYGGAAKNPAIFRSPLIARGGVRKWRKTRKQSNTIPGTIVKNTRIQI